VAYRRVISSLIARGKLPQGYELQAADVGSLLDLGWDGFGPVLPVDVGKRVWRREYGIAMENSEQRDNRKGAQ
jgi:hypothetical protein